MENAPVTGEFPAQRASNAENASIWWRHHEHKYFVHFFLGVYYSFIFYLSVSVPLFMYLYTWRLRTDGGVVKDENDFKLQIHMYSWLISSDRTLYVYEAEYP